MDRTELFSIATFLASLEVAFFIPGFVRLGSVLLALALVALVIWNRTGANRSSGIDWPTLEARLEDLREREIEYGWQNHVAGQIEAAQVDDGNGRQQWTLLGDSAALLAEAERLFRIAGRHLIASKISLSLRVEREQNDLSRWLWFAVEVGHYEKNWTTSHFSPATGQVDKYRYGIQEALQGSIAACVEALKREEELAAK